MELKFTFGASKPSAESPSAGSPLPLVGAGSASAPSGVLELRVLLIGGEELECEGRSGDGVSYASARKRIGGEDPTALAVALRSVLARGGAELPEPLLGSVSLVTLSLDGREREALEALGLEVFTGGVQLATVDDALQARTGIAAGTPIRLAD